MKKLLIALTGVFFIAAFCCFYFKDYYEPYKDELSLIGSIASILGIVLAVIQAYYAKESAGEAALSASDASSKASLAGQSAEAAFNKAELARIQAEKTDQAVRESLKEFNTHLSVIDVAVISKLPNEIKTFLQTGHYHLAASKMMDLKDALSSMAQNPHYREDEKLVEDLNNLVQELTIRMPAVDTAARNKKAPYGINQIDILIENIRTTLVEVTNKSKFKKLY